jgi:hypothetical protein
MSVVSDCVTQVARAASQGIAKSNRDPNKEARNENASQEWRRRSDGLESVG